MAILHWASPSVSFFWQHLLFVSLCHILEILTILQMFIITILSWWYVVSDLWCYYCKKIMMLKIQITVSILGSILNQGMYTFLDIMLWLQYKHNFMCIGKPKNSCRLALLRYLLHCSSQGSNPLDLQSLPIQSLEMRRQLGLSVVRN